MRQPSCDGSGILRRNSRPVPLFEDRCFGPRDRLNRYVRNARDLTGKRELPHYTHGVSKLLDQLGMAKPEIEIKGIRHFGASNQRCLLDDSYRRGRYKSVLVPKNTSADCITVSESVGCGWMVSATSFASAAISIARVPSAISSPAPAPTIPTPSMRSVEGSMISLVIPSVRSRVIALPEAAQGNFATLISRPSFSACVAVSPAQAISGSVNTTAGIAFGSNATLWPAICSMAVRPSCDALCASIGSPMTSPIA